MTTEARAVAVPAGDRGPAVIAVAVVGIVVPTIAVVLRFISRAQARAVGLTNKFWWDDWAILVTLIFSHGFLALNVAWTNYGLGKHYLAVPLSDAMPNNYMSHASIELYAVCIWMIKVSTLLLYTRIFRLYSQTFARILWGFAAFVTAWFLCTALVPWFNCKPISKTLNLFEPGVCYNRMSWFYASAFINAFTDLAILLLPLPAISRLRMTLGKKIWLVTVFLLGYCSAFLSFARFIIIVRNPSVMSTTASADPTWNLIPLLILSMLEAPFAILALCAPPIGQLATRALKHRTVSSLFRSIFSTRRSAGSGGPGDNADRSKTGYSEETMKSLSQSWWERGNQSQNQSHYEPEQAWPPKPPGYGSTTAFANWRESDENSQGQLAANSPSIPLGVITISRGVEVKHDLQRDIG